MTSCKTEVGSLNRGLGMKVDEVYEMYIDASSAVDILSFDLIRKKIEAEFSAKGYSNFKAYIESTMEPYEDWPGDPRFYVTAQRKPTKKELGQEDRENKIKIFAEDNGLSYYEAEIVMRYKKKEGST